LTRLKLNRVLGQRGLHQEATALGLDASELSRLERRIIEPTPRMIEALERFYKRPIDELLDNIETSSLTV